MFRSFRSSRHEQGAATHVHRARGEPPAALVLETLHTPEAVRRLAPEWRELMAAAPQQATIFQSFDWAAACMARLERGTRLCVLTARERGRLVAVAPLVIDRRIGLATLRWIGGSLAIYGDVLADASVDVPAWLDRALDELAAEGEAHSLLLDNVRADARIAPYLQSVGRKSGAKSAPWIDLPGLGSFEAWKARQSRATRRSRSRRQKQLEVMGKLSFAFERSGPDAADRVAELFEMKREWAADRHVVSRTIHARSFEEIVAALVSRDSCLDARFSTLMLDGKAIAIELGFVLGGGYVSYLGAYDPSFETYSPGILQLERTIEACFGERLEFFDLQPPADPYKLSLACKLAPVSNHAIALTRMGRLQTLAAAVDHIELAKSAVGLMPDRGRRMVYAAVQRVRQKDDGREVVETLGTASSILKRALLMLGAGAAVAAIVAD